MLATRTIVLLNMADQEFDDDLPEGCPPSQATLGNATFYAAHKDRPPSSSDFTTAWQRNAFPIGLECNRKSNSVMAGEADARHLLKLYPTRYRFVSSGAVT